LKIKEENTIKKKITITAINANKKPMLDSANTNSKFNSDMSIISNSDGEETSSDTQIAATFEENNTIVAC